MSHVFQSGDRVRLAVEFVGNIWQAGGVLFAGEDEGPDGRGDPIIFPAGSTGTIAPGDDAPGQASYFVIMDDGRMTTLSVRAVNLESIEGRAKLVFSDGGDLLRVVPVFDIQDAVRLVWRVTAQDGTIYEAGTVAGIRPGDLSMSAMQRMEQSWATDTYDIFIPRNDTFLSVPAHVLQLHSDFRPSAQARFDTAAKRGVWSWILAVVEGDQEAVEAISAAGDLGKMLVYATARLLAYMRELGDPVAYGRSMLQPLTEKEASEGLDADDSARRDMWALVVAFGEEDEVAANAVFARTYGLTLRHTLALIETILRNKGRNVAAYCRLMIEAITGEIAMANAKVTCPHCGRQTRVREHYNDPCQHCGKTVPAPYVK
jgi:hypothetical protein